MTEELWENGLREVMSGTAGTARVTAPPTDLILRKGRSSLRLRNGLTGSGVLGVVVAAVIAGTSLAPGSGGGASTAPGAATTSARLPQATDAVVTMGSKSAKTTVVLYEDYRCPPCKEVSEGISSVLRQDAAAGRILVEYRATNLIDRNTDGVGSVVAGNAVQCAANRGDFYAYRDAVYAQQPAESVDSFSSPKPLIQIARGIPGLDTPGFEKCVDDQPYASPISRNYDTAMGTRHCSGVPCIIVNGKMWPGPPTNDLGVAQAFSEWLAPMLDQQ